MVMVVPAKSLTDSWSGKELQNNARGGGVVGGRGGIWFLYFQAAINQTKGKGKGQGR